MTHDPNPTPPPDPDVPRLELFARRPRPGWHVWGNEVVSDVEMGVLK